MHSVLHDWTDERVAEILTNLKPAMTPEYSKLLINEYVIPDTGAHWISTGIDIFMMAIYSSGERTEQDWRRLLEGVGFRIAKIWTPEPGTESLIEAEVAVEVPQPRTQTLTEAEVASEAPDGIASESGTDNLVKTPDDVATEPDTESLIEAGYTAQVPAVGAADSGIASIINADPLSHVPAIVASEPASESFTSAGFPAEEPKPVIN